MTKNQLLKSIHLWISEIKKTVPETNDYFNLKEGISEIEFIYDTKIKDDIWIPNELIDCYKSINVAYNGIASAFSFTLDNGWYQLIPFADIQQHWEGIQDLYFGDDISDADLDKFDPKVKAEDYANPRWIPFADAGQGDYLLFDTDPSEIGTYGQIIELQNVSWERNVIANSLEALIAQQIEKVQQGKPKDFFDFILNKSEDTTVNTESQLITFSANTELKNLLKQVPFEEVKHLIPADSWIYSELENNPKATVEYCDSDLHIDYIDLSQPFIEFERRNEDYPLYLREQSSSLIVINGNLRANNIVSNDDDGATSLVVLGNLEVKNMVVGGSDIHISKELKASGLVWGNYNHGGLYVSSGITAQVVLFTDAYHFDEESTSINAKASLIEDRAQYEDDIVFFIEAAQQMFEQAYLSFFEENLSYKDYEEISGWSSILDRYMMIESLKQNKNVLRAEIGIIEQSKPSKAERIKKVIKKLLPICTKNQQKKEAVFSKINQLEIQEGLWDNPIELTCDLINKLNEIWDDFILVIDQNDHSDKIKKFLSNSLKDNFGKADFDQESLFEQPSRINGIKDLLIAWEQKLNKFDSDFQLTYLDIHSQNFYVLLHEKTHQWIVEFWLKDINIKSYYHKDTFLKLHDHTNVPTIFENKQLKSKDDLKAQKENFCRFFELDHETNYDESSPTFPQLSNAQVTVNKELTSKSDHHKVEQSICFLLENGGEIFVGLEKKNRVNKLVTKNDTLSILYKNLNQNITQYQNIFDFPDVIDTFQELWETFLIHVERSIYYYNKLQKTATAERIKNIVNLPLVQTKYNDFNDSEKSVWLGDYHFTTDSSSGDYVSVVVSAELPSETDFDSRRFYFDAYTNNDVSYRYLSSQLYQTNDFYAQGSTEIKFLDYILVKEALDFFEEIEKNIVQKNEEYIAAFHNKMKHYAVKKPFESKEISGIKFVLKDLKETQELLENCTDFGGNKLFDFFTFFSNDYSFHNSFFLVAENEVIAENLDLKSHLPDSDACFVLGYIFLKKVTISKALRAFDISYAPAVICLDDARIANLYLSANTHYFHQNLESGFLYGRFNRGALYVKQHAVIEFIYSDDFNMHFNQVNSFAIVCGVNQVKANYLLEDDYGNQIQVRSIFLATHNLEEVLYDRFLWQDEDGFKIKSPEYQNKSQDKEHEENFEEFIQNGKNPLDYEKLHDINGRVEVNFEKLLHKIQNSPKIKDLNLEDSIYIDDKNDPSQSYFYRKGETFFQIGKWFTKQHIVVYLTHYYQSETDLTLTYFHSDNSTQKFTFETNLSDGSINSLVVKRIFREAIAALDIK
jgi:hypothetical protein